MGDVGIGVMVVILFIFLLVAIFAGIDSSNKYEQVRFELREFKEQAFARGHMVQCLGRTGFYWECD